MNWAQFKDLVSHMCLAGAVVASWSHTQDVAGSSPFNGMTNIFVSELSEFYVILCNEKYLKLAFLSLLLKTFYVSEIHVTPWQQQHQCCLFSESAQRSCLHAHMTK